jgi:tetratricopeptide (TPR) repeat protein
MEGLFQLNLAEMFNARGDWESAALVCGEAYRIAEERGDPLRLAEALKQRAVIDRNKGRPTFASSSLEEALNLAVEGEDKLLIAEIHREYGNLWESLGRTEEAEANWTESLQGFNELGALLDAAQVKEHLESLPLRRD